MTETIAFETDLFGGSPKMAISASEISIDAITVRANRNVPEISSSVRETRSSFEQPKEMQCSLGGEASSGRTGRKASSAACSETKVRTYRLSLSDRLTQSLISAGLVKGITPSSTRKQSGQPILVLAFDTPVGGAAAEPSPVFSSLNA